MWASIVGYLSENYTWRKWTWVLYLSRCISLLLNGSTMEFHKGCQFVTSQPWCRVRITWSQPIVWTILICSVCLIDRFHLCLIVFFYSRFTILTTDLRMNSLLLWGKENLLQLCLNMDLSMFLVRLSRLIWFWHVEFLHKFE